MIGEIRTAARELLDTDEISCFVGYEEGTRGRVRPAFVYEAEEVDRLVWNTRCVQNLATYLRQFQAVQRRDGGPASVGVMVKPCDSRSLNVLIHDKQLDRDRLRVIGVMCEGVGINGGLLQRCMRCERRTPVGCDKVVGEAPAAMGCEDYADVEQIEALSAPRRLAFWTEAFDRCIRCYACREACPACYCAECTAEQLDPAWMRIAIDVPEKQFFHVMRAFHLAGRCVGCGACEEACPMDIPISLLNRKIARELELAFDYTAGQDAETPPPLATFRKEEDLVL